MHRDRTRSGASSIGIACRASYRAVVRSPAAGDRDSRRGLYIVEPGFKNTRRMLDGYEVATTPAVSPDGRVLGRRRDQELHSRRRETNENRVRIQRRCALPRLVPRWPLPGVRRRLHAATFRAAAPHHDPGHRRRHRLLARRPRHPYPPEPDPSGCRSGESRHGALHRVSPIADQQLLSQRKHEEHTRTVHTCAPLPAYSCSSSALPLCNAVPVA